MYPWINKTLLISQADNILSLDEFIPNAFLTIIMESNDDNFEKVIKWIDSHQNEYSINSRERALIGTDMIKLDALEQKEVNLFIQNHPEYSAIVDV